MELNKLVARCVQKEERLRQNKLSYVHLVSHNSKRPNKGKRVLPKKVNELAILAVRTKKKKANSVPSYKKKWHFKKDCIKQKNWFEKIGNDLYMCSKKLDGSSF